MDVKEIGEGGPRTRPDDDDDDDDPIVPQAWRSKPFRLTVMAAVVVLTAGVGFGAGKLAGAGNNVVRADIPKPETTADPFIEGSGSIADNSHANILSTTAPGMVHILSDGKPVGIGLVLTQSGKVLTTYQPAKGALNLSAKYVLSGATFTATVIGTDPAAGLALLQMASRPGWPFVTVEVGNSDSLVHNADISSFTSYHVPGMVYDTAVGTTGTAAKVTIDAGTLTGMNVTVGIARTSKTRSGLMASTLQSDMLSVLGGPLVDLNGKVIGITIGGSGGSASITGYAIPINTALADAQQIAGQLQPAGRHRGREAEQQDSDDGDRSECEPHREVVLAERGAADQQPPSVPVRGVRRGFFLGCGPGVPGAASGTGLAAALAGLPRVAGARRGFRARRRVRPAGNARINPGRWGYPPGYQGRSRPLPRVEGAVLCRFRPLVRTGVPACCPVRGLAGGIYPPPSAAGRAREPSDPRKPARTTRRHE